MTTSDIMAQALGAALVAALLVPAGGRLLARLLIAAGLVLLRHSEASSAAYNAYVDSWKRANVNGI